MRISNFFICCVSLVFAVIISGQANAAIRSHSFLMFPAMWLSKPLASRLLSSCLPPFLWGPRIDLPAGAKLSIIYVAKGEEYKLAGRGKLSGRRSLTENNKRSCTLKAGIAWRRVEW